MSFINFFISYERSRNSISRERLSYGLGISNDLSKIEYGEISADKFIYDTFLQRLGIGESYFEHYVLDEDHKLQELKTKIIEEIYLKQNVDEETNDYLSSVSYNSNFQ